MDNPSENQGVSEARPPLMERLDSWWLEKNNFKKFNGGCEIGADPVATLRMLADNVMPRQENLAELVRASVEDHDKTHRKLEVIWAEKIAQGATHVGVLDGSFHFFKGEEILPEDNVDLTIPVIPPILQLRENEHAEITRLTHLREIRFRDENAFPGAVEAGRAAARAAVVGEVVGDGGVSPLLDSSPIEDVDPSNGNLDAGNTAFV